jgi:hypothetical protein
MERPDDTIDLLCEFFGGCSARDRRLEQRRGRLAA